VKLNETGSKINSSMTQIEKTWNELMKISDQQADALKIYGKFLIEIVNDEENGEALIKKAQILSLDKTNKKKNE
jgi:hypothetical protein